MLANSRLSPLQVRILALLDGISPAWTLTGGAALAGFILGHRTTRDLDLFWRGASELGALPAEVERRLRAAQLDVAAIQSAPAFRRLSVKDDHERILVDLVADPTATIEPPARTEEGFQIDSRHEILVNKLCTLLSRTEVRDLEDVRALLAAGGDLDRALHDAPQKDGGFSPLVLAWSLSQLPLMAAREAGFDQARLEAFRDELIRHLTPP